MSDSMSDSMSEEAKVGLVDEAIATISSRQKNKNY